MSALPARFTIERSGAPSDRRAKRFLGHDDSGRLCWMSSFTQANTYESLADAASFRRHRIGESAGAIIVSHTIH